jgi:hypothetical protein
MDKNTKIDLDRYYTINEAQNLLWYKNRSSIVNQIQKWNLKAPIVGGVETYKLRRILGQELEKFRSIRDIIL